MKHFLKFPSGSLLALAMIFFLVPATHAQQYDSVRVVRVSRAEGQVLVSHQGGDWEEALVNLPLQEGDTLATQDGRAEVEFENGATSYLAENSALQFTQLGFFGAGGRATELNLTEGAGTFYANPTGQDSFRVVTVTLDIAISDRAEFRVDVFPDGAAVEALTGTVTVSTTRGSTQLEKGESVAVHENDLKDFSVGRLPEPDTFDQWVTEEGEIIRSGNKNTLSYINSPNYYGLADLSLYGSWINLPGLGISWRPFRAGISWTPYLNGIWILDAHLGWIWVSNEPWGWMPFHFGTWQLSPTLGWVWIPGGPGGLRHWEPARVNWVRAGNQVGWVAMSPNDRDGVAANIQNGVVTRPGQNSRAPNSANEILSGKALLGSTPLKEPPKEFASRLSLTGVERIGVAPAIRTAAPMQERSSSIVFDRDSHTFINRDGPTEADRQSKSRAGILPQPNMQNENPRVTVPSTGSVDSRINRVLLPPPYPTAPGSRANMPASGVAPARSPVTPTTMTPLGSSPRVVAPPAMPAPVAPSPLRGNPGPPAAAPPRPVTPPPAPPPPPAPRPAAPQMQNQFGSAPRPAPSPEPKPEQRR